MKKDQSFFLCQMPSCVLPSVQFPIGSLMKYEVKRLAEELDLHRIAQKNESKLKQNSYYLTDRLLEFAK